MYTRKILFQSRTRLSQNRHTRHQETLDQISRQLLKFTFTWVKHSLENISIKLTPSPMNQPQHSKRRPNNYISKNSLKVNTQQNKNRGGNQKLVYNLTDWIRPISKKGVVQRFQLCCHTHTCTKRRYHLQNRIHNQPARRRYSRNSETRNIPNTTKKKKKPRTPNITAKEISLWNKDILVLLADKEDTMVIMKTEDYHNKLKNLLSDTTYSITPWNPTTYLEKKTRLLIQKSSLDKETKLTLIPK